VRIALLIHELLINGGGERQCVCLARALARQGHKVTVFTCAYDRTNCFPEICKGITVREVGRRPLSWLRNPWFIRGYLDMTYLAASIEEEHDIWNPHHWPAQWAAIWLKRRLGGSVLWMCNDVPTFYAKAHQLKNVVSSFVHWLYYLYDRHQNEQSDLTALVSSAARRDFKPIYCGETIVIWPGVDPQQFRPGGDRSKIRRRFGYADSDFVLLWLGIFMPHRRLEDAIGAIARLRGGGTRVKLLLAGSDRSYPEYLRGLKSLATRLGVADQITFTGSVADDEMRDFYCACDAFIFPNDQQTWGLAVLEAMACGCPVLVSRGTGVHEVLTEGENALLFAPRQPEVLAQKIELLISQPKLRRGIAQIGMQMVRNEYTWTNYAARVSQACKQLVSFHISPGPMGDHESGISAKRAAY
jgi:glycosyltransferase involved in cell wall biosynthesis